METVALDISFCLARCKVRHVAILWLARSFSFKLQTQKVTLLHLKFTIIPLLCSASLPLLFRPLHFNSYLHWPENPRIVGACAWHLICLESPHLQLRKITSVGFYLWFCDETLRLLADARGPLDLHRILGLVELTADLRVRSGRSSYYHGSNSRSHYPSRRYGSAYCAGR